MNRPLLSFSVLLATLLAAGAFLSADEVVLKDGRKFTGEIVQETGQQVSIRTIGGVLTFSRNEVARAVRKADPRKAYGEKDDRLVESEIAMRFDLGKWCMEHSLPQQARRQFEIILQLDPQNEEALQLISKLAGPRRQAQAPDVDITLTDSSRIKGRLINSVITVEMLYGTLRIPSDQVTAITMGDPRGKDVVETASFKVQGAIKDQTFIVDTKLGRLSVGKNDIKSFAVRQLTPAQLAEAAFQAAMRRLDRTGIDVMIVMDTTDSMVGIAKTFVDDAPKMWDFIHKHVPNTRIGVVSYRDAQQFNPDEFEYVVKCWPMTSERETLLNGLKELTAKGGGDIPEAVYEGLREAVEKGGWRDDATRLIILIGDAPPHKENKGMERTLQLVTDWNRKAGGVFHAVDTTGWNKLMFDFIEMAKAGGGQSLSLNEEKKLVPTLIPLMLGAEHRDRLLADYEGRPFEAPAPVAPDESAVENRQGREGILIIEE